MTVHQTGLVFEPGQSGSYSVVGTKYTFKAVGEETGEAYALFELTVPPQGGAPLHRHQLEDEAFYVQEGEVEFQLGEEVIVGTAGTCLHSPKGQFHRFKNIGSAPAKLLCWVVPAGLEKFFAEVGKPLASPADMPPPVTPADVEKLLATAPKYQLEVIPPPSECAQ